MSRAKKESERRERAKQFKAGVKPYDLTRLTAFHEAGHVVFSTLHDNDVEIVTIDPQKVEELTGRKGCPGYTRYTKESYGDADTVLMMTAVGLTSEALLVSGGVINPEEDDLRLIHEMLENQLGLQGEAKNREFMRIRLLTALRLNCRELPMWKQTGRKEDRELVRRGQFSFQNNRVRQCQSSQSENSVVGCFEFQQPKAYASPGPKPGGAPPDEAEVLRHGAKTYPAAHHTGHLLCRDAYTPELKP